MSPKRQESKLLWMSLGHRSSHLFLAEFATETRKNGAMLERRNGMYSLTDGVMVHDETRWLGDECCSTSLGSLAS